jgi:hypothetical protein
MSSAKKTLSILLSTVVLVSFATPSMAAFTQDKPTPEKTDEKTDDKKSADKKDSDEKDDDKDKKKKKPKFKKYDEVITEKAVTKKGVFTTHHVDDKYYFEIDPKTFGDEYVWVTQFSKMQSHFGFAGVEVKRRIVKFERLQDSILMRNIEYDLRADDGTPEKLSVDASSLPQVTHAFKIETFGENKTPVIDVTDFFKNDIAEFSPKSGLKATGIDKNRTFITSMKTFDRNIETRVLATYKLKPMKPVGYFERENKPKDTSLSSVTVELHHSMVKLPDRPMRPRYFDKRVGFFSGSYTDFSSKKDQVDKINLIRRWRLEKKDPSAAMSEPVQPIIYYVGRGVPEKYRQATIEGIEMWQEAFEQAGFKNAIIGKFAPSKEEDPSWDPEDARYSTVRWLASNIPNAYGPHVQDPRTGEILEADVRMFHNVISLVRDWYFVQASPNDPASQQLPLPDDVMKRAIRYVVAHEVGHTLGFQHNMISTNSYPVEKYRDKEWTMKYGTESSIMDYGRFNYIAQPGDGSRLIPIIGPYDKFAVEWGYSEFAGSKDEETDKAHLNKIANRMIDDPMLRFGAGNRPNTSYDPRAQTEDLGDDAVAATKYGMLNLERVAGYIVKATSKNDEHHELLNHMYGRMIGQMWREFGHVANLVGGIEHDKLVYGQGEDVYKPTPKAKQKEAVQYLLSNAFKVPKWALGKDVISRIGMHGVTNRITNGQVRILKSLLHVRKANSMMDLEGAGYDHYPLIDLFAELEIGLFEEVVDSDPKIDIFRRNIQRAYVDQLISYITPGSTAKNDLKAVSRGRLLRLQARLSTRINGTSESIENFHLIDLNKTIANAMEGKFAPAKKPSGPGGFASEINEFEPGYEVWNQQ